jgi:tetratricopeptide (TPR) repeat protein
MKQAVSYLKLAADAAPNDLRTAEELSAVLGAEGQKEKSEKLTAEWLRRFPQSHFLLERAGRPDLPHLANDTYRVLNVASAYMRLGMYAQALDVLSRNYPAAVANESEPGQLPPNRHPLVAYYRGYCRQKLGQSGAGDFSAAARLSTDYVFPSRLEDMEVLTAASKANPQDASAHYLLGTLYFAKGLTDEALAEWDQARQENPHIPVLHASLGRALLHAKNDPEQALGVFQEGLSTDPNNIALYTGIDQAMSIVRRSPQERVSALEQYPDHANMPTSLVYELILSLAESGEYDKAAGLFRDRFFQREEGGTNVRQVWLEVQIQRALSKAEHGQCREAINTVDHVREPVPDLAFTHDGLEPFLRSGRLQYLLGRVYAACNSPEKARISFQQAAEKWDFEDATWAWKASRQLPNFDPGSARQRLGGILEHVKSAGESSAPSGRWFYNVAMLNSALGNTQQAEKEFSEALLSADSLMTYHLTRLAMSGSTP